MPAPSLVDPEGPIPDTWFLGLSMSARVRREVVARLGLLPASWPAVAWTRPSGWHVTVAYLGRLEPGRPEVVLDRVTAAVAESLHGPARLSLGPPRWFGRALAMVAIADPGLVAVQARVAAAVADPGEVGDADVAGRRAWQPHVTLARRRRTSVGGLVDDVAATLDGAPIDWTPRAVTLFGSRAGTGPARYVAEACVPLARDTGS